MRFVGTLSPLYSNYTNSTLDDEDVPIYFYFLIICGIFLTVFTVLANLCTMLLLVRYRPLQKSISNLYILSLAMADCLLAFAGLVLLIFRLVASRWSWLWEQRWLCDSGQILDLVLTSVSLYSICSIALDRVWNLEKPLRVFKRSRRLARRLILCIWCLPFCIWLPYYFLATDSMIYGQVTAEVPIFGMKYCTSEYRSRLAATIVVIPALYVPAIALVLMFVRISLVVHGHLSFLRDHSNNPPPASTSFRASSRDSTPFSRTPEPSKKMSESSVTSGYCTVRSPRCQSPRYPRMELTPLSEEKSSGRERSLSEQYSGRIELDNNSNNHLRVKSCTSNPTRRESLEARQLIMNQRGDHFYANKSYRKSSRRHSAPRNSQSAPTKNSPRRFSVIQIPSNLQDLLQREGISQQVRAAKAVAVILFTFLACWLPFLILWPIKVYCRSCVDDFWFTVASCLNYSCSALNPLLYTLSSPRVRLIIRSYFSFFFCTKKKAMPISMMKSGTMI